MISLAVAVTARCDGFIVATPTKRLGRVAGVRFSPSTNEPELLEVKTGLLGRTLILLSVEDVTEIDPEQKRVIVSDPPRLVPG